MQDLQIVDHNGMSNGIVRLIRWPNLILLATIQFLVFVIGHPESWVYLVLTTAMTVSAAAAGYIINDATDLEADRVNDRINPIGTGHISLRSARRGYVLLTIVGAAFSLTLSWAWSWHFLWIYAGTTLLLWLYSLSLKAMPLVGNFSVSVFCGMAVLIVWYPVVQFEFIPQRILMLSGFAFLVTFIREIVKDLEDMRGDLEAGYRTLPIVCGVSLSKVLTVILTLVSVTVFSFLPDTFSNYCLASLACDIITMTLLITAGMYLIVRANNKIAYHRISTILKIAMLSGSLSLLL